MYKNWMLLYSDIPVHPEIHFIIHATDVKVSVKNARSNPVIIAPTILVATKLIARRITENRTVPRIPHISELTAGQRHDLAPRLVARYTDIGAAKR